MIIEYKNDNYILVNQTSQPSFRKNFFFLGGGYFKHFVCTFMCITAGANFFYILDFYDYIVTGAFLRYLMTMCCSSYILKVSYNASDTFSSICELTYSSSENFAFQTLMYFEAFL